MATAPSFWEVAVQVLTIILALWGAGLSTYLAIREIYKERRIIKITLEHVVFYDRVQARIVNIGHRPITINRIGMSLHFKDGKQIKLREVVPAQFLVVGPAAELKPITDEVYGSLPVTLEDGQQVLLGVRRISRMQKVICIRKSTPTIG